MTGGTGFTGSKLVEYLIDKGHDVIALDTQKGIMYDYLQEKGANIILGSVTDREAVKKSLEGVRCISSGCRSDRSMQLKTYWDVNEGTRILCENHFERPIRKFVTAQHRASMEYKNLPG